MENLKEQPKYMERVNRLKEKVFETYPEIDLEDAKPHGAFSRRRGACRERQKLSLSSAEKTVKIWDDELIIGIQAAK